MTTIEDFFIKEYETLKEENIRLKEKLNQFDVNQYGFTDLQISTNLIQVSLNVDLYNLKNNNSLLSDYSDEKLQEITDLNDEDLIEKLKTTPAYVSSYYRSDYILAIETLIAPYTLRLHDPYETIDLGYAKGSFITINRDPTKCVLDKWEIAENQERLESQAVIEFRNVIKDYIKYRHEKHND